MATEYNFESGLSLTDLELYRRTQAALGRVGAFPKAQGAVCFVWDDGYADHHTVRLMADARGQRHTFAINSGLLDQTNRMTTAQVLAAFRAGHEIASHGVQHLNMASQTVAVRTAQYDDSKTALEAIVGAGNVTTFVYPNGYTGRNAATDQELYLRYRRVRMTTSPLGGQGQNRYRTDERDAFMIGAQAWYDSQNMVLEQIKSARDTNTIVVIYAHAFGTGAGNGTNEPSLTQVAQAMDYAQTLGVPCVTLAEAFPGHPLLRDPGFEQFAIGDTAWFYQGTAGPGAYAEIVTDTSDVGMPGTKSLHLVATGAGTFSYVAQAIPVIPGRTYTISGRYRTVGVTSATNAVALRTRGRDYLGVYTGASPTYGNLFSDTWARFTLDMPVPQDASALSIEPIVNAVAAELYIDHLHVAVKAQGSFG